MVAMYRLEWLWSQSGKREERDASIKQSPVKPGGACVLLLQPGAVPSWNSVAANVYFMLTMATRAGATFRISFDSPTGRTTCDSDSLILLGEDFLETVRWIIDL